MPSNRKSVAGLSGSPGQYRFITRALGRRSLKHLKVAIGLLCMSMLALGTIVEMHPLGPQGTGRMIHELLTASSFLVGVCWIVRPWPSRRMAIVFVVWADLAMAISPWTYAGATMRLSAAMYMGLIGVFAAFLLGWRILAAHCVFASAVFASITVWNIHTGAATFLDQFFYNAAALTTMVLLPILIQAVIEAAWRSARATASAANRDPLTGLLNRRGVLTAIELAVRARKAPVLVSVAVIDIDYFKDLNDTYGHEAGDATLRTTAEMLSTNIRDGDIAARIGGDEFMVVALVDRAEDIDGIIQRIRHAQPATDSPNVSISIGVAWSSTDTADFNFESLTRQADFRLYEAKRARSSRAGSLT
ncbi:GGDEF domain-containing protein [Mycobacteroides sp. LB1]|uniref:GGDEF domain-containing protein n=1 Tax=Mycobacteroides sp. LB1 TaxID=2750814 RepID=UPI0015DE28A4|nr:GGDEF domain-containing protein [Mycobacteroides sp. LB1]